MSITNVTQQRVSSSPVLDTNPHARSDRGSSILSEDLQRVRPAKGKTCSNIKLSARESLSAGRAPV